MHSKLPIIAAIAMAIISFLGFSPSARESTVGTSTGLGTGSTTGGSGFTSSGNIVYVVNMAERRSASTYGYFSGSWQTLTGRHCVGVQFHSQSWSYAGTPPSNVSSITHHEGVYAAVGTEWGSVPSGTTLGLAPTGSSAPGGAGHGGDVAAGSDFVMQTSDTGAIESGRHLKWYILTTTVTTYNDSTPTLTEYSWDGPFEHVLVKLACDDASLTTRRTYGQPNKGGELPADPNAPLRHPNYGPWDHKGGLFVGNIPSNDKDASGTSRADFFVQGASSYESDYEFAALSVYDMGKPSDSYTTGAIDVGLYLPGSSDSLLTSLTESNVNWDYQWNITPGAYDAMSTDWTQHPFHHITLTDGNSEDYIVFRLTGIAMSSHPATALKGACLAIVDEAATVSATTKCWHYFASSEYQTGSTYPRNDVAPRVWLIQAYTP